MTRNKKLLLIIFLSTPLFAEVKMIPLNEYMKEQNMSEPNVLFYVSARCGAINFNMAHFSENIKDLYERGSKVGETFSQMAIAVIQTIQPNDSAEENQRIAVESISAIANEYLSIMNENYAKTGTYFTDWMIDDLSTCSAFYSQATTEE